MMSNRTFDDIAASAVDYLLKTSPVRATQAGVHDFDAELDTADRTARRERIRRLSGFVDEIGLIQRESLGFDQRIDLQILQSNLRAEIVFDSMIQRWDRDPSLALEISLYGCLSLVMRDFAPFEERISSLIGRVTAIPRLLEEAKENLTAQSEVPTVWAEMAEELCGSAKGFLQSLIAEISPQSEQGKGLVKAVEAANSAVSDYLLFLTTKLTSRSRGSYACGWETFASLLEYLHGIEMSEQELIRFGANEIERISGEMERTAAVIDSNKTAEELLEELKAAAPISDDLLSVYREYVERSEQFLRGKELISLPSDMHLEVVTTPEFVRRTYPFAAYVTPAALDPNQPGMFWVTPVSPSLQDPNLVEAMRNHNPYRAQLIALHEGFPGHHVQLTLATRHPSRIRKLFDCNVFVEGWALYCEEMMWEQGYFSDLRFRLMQLHLELWRACRVVIDVKLHTGAMTFTEAVNLLVDVAKIDKLSSIAEVKRYSQSPTQPLSYLVGKAEILGLRTDCRRLWGEQYSIKAFHDKLLALGSVPLGIARAALLEQL